MVDFMSRVKRLRDILNEFTEMKIVRGNRQEDLSRISQLLRRSNDILKEVVSENRDPMEMILDRNILRVSVRLIKKVFRLNKGVPVELIPESYEEKLKRLEEYQTASAEIQTPMRQV